MKGLLLKDLYTLGKQMKIFLVLIVVLAVIPGFSLSAFAVVYAALLPMTALSYDERSKWDTLAAMMPYSAAQLVFSKYLLGYLMAVCAALCSLAAQVVISLYWHTPLDQEALISLLSIVCIAFLFLAIDLPFLFKLGVERGRLTFIILTVVMVTAGILFFNDTLIELMTQDSTFTWLAFCCPMLTIIFNLLSVPLSVKLYKSNFK